jgi:hypothetical protein
MNEGSQSLTLQPTRREEPAAPQEELELIDRSEPNQVFPEVRLEDAQLAADEEGQVVDHEVLRGERGAELALHDSTHGRGLAEVRVSDRDDRIDLVAGAERERAAEAEPSGLGRLPGLMPRVGGRTLASAQGQQGHEAHSRGHEAQKGLGHGPRKLVSLGNL